MYIYIKLQRDKLKVLYVHIASEFACLMPINCKDIKNMCAAMWSFIFQLVGDAARASFQMSYTTTTRLCVRTRGVIGPSANLTYRIYVRARIELNEREKKTERIRNICVYNK